MECLLGGNVKLIFLLKQDTDRYKHLYVKVRCNMTFTKELRVDLHQSRQEKKNQTGKKKWRNKYRGQVRHVGSVRPQIKNQKEESVFVWSSY